MRSRLANVGAAERTFSKRPFFCFCSRDTHCTIPFPGKNFATKSTRSANALDMRNHFLILGKKRNVCLLMRNAGKLRTATFVKASGFPEM